MQSVPITTKVVNLNQVHARCTQYNIMWWSLSVTYDKSVVFSEYSPWYNWNIVESGVKHPNPKFKVRLCEIDWCMFNTGRANYAHCNTQFWLLTSKVIRPKKIKCVFTVTCQKNLGSGLNFFFNFFLWSTKPEIVVPGSGIRF
jgi:hypothetical protein